MITKYNKLKKELKILKSIAKIIENNYNEELNNKTILNIYDKTLKEKAKITDNFLKEKIKIDQSKNKLDKLIYKNKKEC